MQFLMLFGGQKLETLNSSWHYVLETLKMAGQHLAGLHNNPSNPHHPLDPYPPLTSNTPRPLSVV